MAESQGQQFLSEINPGVTVSVLSFQGGQSLAQRLSIMGFTPGAVLKMDQNYHRGPIIVNVRGTRVALGRGEAERIVVARVNYE